MAIDATTLPTIMAGVETGGYGNLEHRQTHTGAIKLLHDEAGALFGPELLTQIRNAPPGRAITVPLIDRQDWAVLTTRSCSFNCVGINSRVTPITRTHFAIDICINPDDYNLNYLTPNRVLQTMMSEAMRAVYTLWDTLAATYVDTNKSTNMVADAGGATPDANPLYTQKTGYYQMKDSPRFFAYLPTIMQQFDITPPFVDLTNTLGNADRTMMGSGGPGAIQATNALMQGAGIEKFEFSNRVAASALTPVHYIMQKGSIGVTNIIDPVYKNKPQIGTRADMAQWKEFENKTEFKIWSQTADPMFPDWNWGVLQEAVCENETIKYMIKLSCDLAFSRDFTSTAGLTPIKKFILQQMYMPTYLA